MPYYTYRREDGTLFEVKQSIKDKPLETCPETNQKVRRIIKDPGVPHFKGTGFYETDYK